MEQLTFESHNVEHACLKCCAINERLNITLDELDKVLANFRPENLENLSGPLGMIIRQLFKG